MGGFWRSGSRFRTASAFGASFAGSRATIGRGPTSAERDRLGDQALKRRLQFLGAGFAQLEDDRAAGVDEEDLPGPLPAGPGQVLTQRPPCRQRVRVNARMAPNHQATATSRRFVSSSGASEVAGKGTCASPSPRTPAAASSWCACCQSSSKRGEENACSFQ